MLIPCFDEERTVGTVVRDFRQALPDATVYVYDNGSRDRTAEIARAEGAQVRRERRQGKGFVVASMFDQVIAHRYVLVDGDDTYPAEYARRMLEILDRGDAEMVVASRAASYKETRVRPFHGFGNWLVGWLINLIWGTSLRDPMSGYRALTYQAVCQLPLRAGGFDVETEMTIQALHRRLVIEEIEVPYRDRPPGSPSKLSTLPDGARVLTKIFLLLKAYKPMTFFGLLGIGCSLIAAGALAATVPALLHDPSTWAVIVTTLAFMLFLAGAVFAVTGIILHTINVRIMEGQILMARSESHRGGPDPTKDSDRSE